jgi:cystathionine beta-lyase
MKHPASLCVAVNHDVGQGIVPPVHTATAYHFVQRGPRTYPRCFNTPNQEAVAQKIAELEHAEAGLVFGSGMAAISTCLLALVKPGDHVVLPRGLYGGTRSFVVNEFERFGIKYDLVQNSAQDFADTIAPATRVIFAESPTNPRLEVLDLRAVCELADERNVLTVVDNTFASPINQNPIDLGADLVVHSGTKYLGGHSDLSCGAVVGEASLIERVRRLAENYGGMLNPLGCYLLDRSLKTLAVRVQRQNENAIAIARFLEQQEAVPTVLYPGLDSHPQHHIAVSQMAGFGGMISFELRRDLSVTRFLNQLRVATPAISLGGVETTLCVPAFTSHAELTEEQQLQCGVTRQLVRLSTGIEDYRDLVSDLEQALANC